MSTSGFLLYVTLLTLGHRLFIQKTLAEKCASKSYGEGNIVCVCNKSYCDKLVLPNVGRDSVLVVESSKDGKRFETRHLNFTRMESKPSVGLKTWDLLVNTSKKYQKIIGFGGAFTDSAALNIRTLSDDLQRQLIEGYFGEKGIGYNMARVPIGGCDMSIRPYALDEVQSDFQLSNFSLAEEDLYYKIPLMKIANQVSPQEVYYFGSSWSPPAWMKTNQMLNGSGTLIGPVGGLYYDTYARYLIRFIQEYEKRGIKFWGLTPQNEPLTGFVPNFKWNTLAMNGSIERDFLSFNLGPLLKDAGYEDLKVMIYDQSIETMVNFSTSVLQDEEAAKFASGISLHWYANYLNIYQELDKLTKRFPEKFILATEACYDENVPVVALGDWSRGEGYAKDIIEDLNHGVTGWVEWNLALNEEGGPSWVNNYLDAMIIVNSTGSEYYKNPMFYVMGHFSKFVKRNSVRLETHSSGTAMSKDLKAVSVLTAEKEVVTVAMNPTEEDVAIRIRDDQRRTFELTLKARSILTAVYQV